MVELEMGLLHLQQNIDIPEVTLTINPTVLSIISRCAEENRKPKVSDFGALVEDSKFLNQLQAGVNRWIKEIQKVNLYLNKIKSNLIFSRWNSQFYEKSCLVLS